MRASTADRERAVDVLKAAFAEGRLDQTEYSDRVGQVYSSRTYGELADLTADLPVGPLGTLPPGPGMPVPWQPVPYQPVLHQTVPYPTAPYQPVPYQPVPSPPATRAPCGMAFAAFLVGLGSFVTLGIFAPLAIVLAVAAAVRMRRTGEAGAGLAVAGLVLGLIDLLAFHTIWTIWT